jgi:5'(3')-deoxyribonucleotidase
MWVQQHLGDSAKKKLILCHNKGLVIGDFLIDDRIANGVADFKGEHIHFGNEQFPGWETVLEYLKSK